MTGKGYTGLDIAEGGAASRAFIALLNGALSKKEVEKTRKALLEYCKQDTIGMIDILHALIEEVD